MVWSFSLDLRLDAITTSAVGISSVGGSPPLPGWSIPRSKWEMKQGERCFGATQLSRRCVTFGWQLPSSKVNGT
ncbi:hypothetical protein EV356DRAFT_99930 [Viridothelium virens]|uniref:Uncharacterized protein n=1 Tax=Viridothelium virens TaxID=1048519 RepID=A0A6A6HMT4_VIRVR|nr:hypothetical protein EV356DRAFT_99930 [Viridothelium virens]